MSPGFSQASSHYSRWVASGRAFLAFRGFLLKSFPKKRARKTPRILVELNSFASSHIAYAYLANVLSQKHSASMAAFSTRGIRASGLSKILRRPEFYKLRWYAHPYSSIYRAFGCATYIHPAPTRKHRQEALAVTQRFFEGNPTKTGLEQFEHAGIKIGDLIYDSLLKNHRLPTIEMQSRVVRKGFQSAVEELLWWNNMITSAEVAGVLVSHANYTIAIPARVAIAKGIDVFEPTLVNLYRLNQERPIDSDFLDFPKLFRDLTEREKNQARSLAKKKLDRRFSGEVGVDMHYSSASAFGKLGKTNVLSKSCKPKILVAAHCFFDNPHSYGVNLFPDFWEWLDFLGRFSESSDFEWYLKSHPDVLPGNIEVLEEFCKRYENFHLLDPETSHHQIISEGISAALTVYGTIGIEYATLGVPVINASANNPHIAYGFNYHPRTVAEYTRLIKAIPDLRAIGSREEIEECYFMRHHYGNGNLYIKDWPEALASLGGHESQFSPIVYSAFLSRLTRKQHLSTLRVLRHFVDSGNHRLYFYEHPE